MNYLMYCIKNLPAVTICVFCIHFTAAAQTEPAPVKDRDGNTYPVRLMTGGNQWTLTNLSINIPGSYGYDSAQHQNRQYGRLYTWQAAQEGCRLLGNGWRLPRNDEWQQLGKAYGGVRDDSDDGGKGAYQALIAGGTSGFNIVYGGGYDTATRSYARVDAHGFYWTATESDSANAWFYNFGRNGKIMNRLHDGQKHWAISVRCIRNTGK